MSQYYRASSIVIKAEERHLTAAALSKEAFDTQLAEHYVGNASSYPWGVKDPIVYILSKGIFPPGSVNTLPDGSYIYNSAVGLWYEDIVQAQDFVFKFLAGLGVELYVETVSRDSQYQTLSSKMDSGILQTEDNMNIGYSVEEYLEERILRLVKEHNYDSLMLAYSPEAKYIRKILSIPEPVVTPMQTKVSVEDLKRIL